MNVKEKGISEEVKYYRKLLEAQREIKYLKETIKIHENTIEELREITKRQLNTLDEQSKSSKEVIEVLKMMSDSQGTLAIDIIDLVVNGVPQKTIHETVKKEYPDYLKPLK